MTKMFRQVFGAKCWLIASFLAGESRADLLINEISGIMDGSNGCVVVELRNAGTVPAPLTGLIIANGKGDEFAVSSLDSVPPAGFALFIFTGSGGETSGELTEGVSRVRFTGEIARTIFRGINGECALYAPRSDGQPEKLLSYVCWDGYPSKGDTPTNTFKSACKNGLWSHIGGSHIQIWTNDDGGNRVGGSNPRLPPGGSISRMQHVNLTGKRAWFLNAPVNTSLGRDNPPPIVHIPYTISRARIGVPVWLTCSAAGYIPSESTKFRFQVASDRAFNGLLRDELSRNIISHTFDMEGTYYWRVRLEEGTLVGNWHFVAKIEISRDSAPSTLDLGEKS